MASTKRVAAPTQRIKIPEANGSSVPECPTLALGTARAITSTTDREVMPDGLSTTRIPCSGGPSP